MTTKAYTIYCAAVLVFLLWANLHGVIFLNWSEVLNGDSGGGGGGTVYYRGSGGGGGFHK